MDASTTPLNTEDMEAEIARLRRDIDAGLILVRSAQERAEASK